MCEGVLLGAGEGDRYSLMTVVRDWSEGVWLAVCLSVCGRQLHPVEPSAGMSCRDKLMKRGMITPMRQFVFGGKRYTSVWSLVRQRYLMCLMDLC